METMSKYGSAINRPLCEIVGLSTDTKPTDKTEGIRIQNGSVFIEMDTGKKYMFDAENSQWKLIGSGGGGGGGSATLIEKSITTNGTYNASNDNADGYSKVTVDVDSSFNNIQTIIINSDNEDERVAIRRSNNGVYNIGNSQPLEILLDPVVKIDFVNEGAVGVYINFTPAENFDGIYKFGSKLNPTGDTITIGDGKLYKYYLSGWQSWAHGTVTKHDTNFISIIS